MKVLRLLWVLCLMHSALRAWPQLTSIDNSQNNSYVKVTVTPPQTKGQRRIIYYLIAPKMILPPTRYMPETVFGYEVGEINGVLYRSCIVSVEEGIPGAWAGQYITIEVCQDDVTFKRFMEGDVVYKAIYRLQLNQADDDSPLLPVIKTTREKAIVTVQQWPSQVGQVGIKIDADGTVSFDDAKMK